MDSINPRPLIRMLIIIIVFKNQVKRFIKIDKNKGEVIYEDFKFRFVKYW